MDIEFRANKILGKMESYVPGDQIKSRLSSYVGPLPDGILGIYVNSMKDENLILVGRDWVAVSGDGEIDLIRYSDISDLRSPPKSASDGITVMLKDGSSKHIPIANGRGQFRDVYEFARFLMRSVEAVRTV